MTRELQSIATKMFWLAAPPLLPTRLGDGLRKIRTRY